MPTLEDAIALAARAHAGQTDKVGEPYILYRTHYEGEPPDTEPIPCEKPACIIP